ncbi:MAG: 3-isopropylmalate dehydratase large subunit [Candidatus Dormibacteria bacterium]
MTVTEKIISRHSGRDSVRAGDVVLVEVDLACIDDVQFFIFKRRLEELGGSVARPDRVVLMADHYSPPSGPDEAGIVRALTLFGRERGLRTTGVEGIKHPVFIEERMILPGQVLVATDSHTNTGGAVSVLAVALGPSDLAAIFATGQTWLRVPECIRFEVEGTLRSDVMPMDVGLSLLGQHGREFGNYRTIEWAGSAVRGLGIPGRLTLCNLTTEFGAKNGIIEADAVTAQYAGGQLSVDALVSDPDARYASRFTYRAEEFEPVVAAPSSPANVHSVRDLRGTRIDQAYLGTCTHSTLEDLHAAASVLRGRKVAQGVQLLVTPATRRVYNRALQDGTLAVLADAGATICSPGCGSCPGMHEGTLGEDQVRISTQNRNFIGRSGHPSSQVYLASPLTVAASAVAGYVVEPLEVLT